DVGPQGKVRAMFLDHAETPKRDRAHAGQLLDLRVGHVGHSFVEDRIPSACQFPIVHASSFQIKKRPVSYTGRPPTRVAKTFVSGILSSGISMMLSDKITRSASFPGSIDPIRSSQKVT